MFDGQEEGPAKEGAADTLQCGMRSSAEECGGKTGDEWSRRMLRKMGRIAGISGWQANVTTGLLRYTHGMEGILDANPGSVSSIRSVPRLFFRESWKRLRESSRRAIDEHLPFELELQMRGSNGGCVWVRVFGEACCGECNQIWLEGDIQDISDRQQILHELAEERRVLRDLVELSLGGYWDWLVQEDRAVFSNAYLRMFGYGPGELPGTLDTWKFLVFEEDMPVGLSALQEHFASRGSRPCRFEARYRHKNGSTVRVLSIGSVIAWHPDGRPLRMVGCHIDITEIKRTEAARILAEEKLEAASIAERRELAMEIHDGAGQILTAIAMKAKLLHDLTEPGGALHKNSSELLGMVSQAQTRIRAISHGLTWQRVDRFNLVPAIRHLLDSCTKGFDMATDYLGEEKIHFQTDWEALHVFLIIQEAILNARRHSGADRLVVAVHAFSGCWAFRVTDNGKGFAFDPGRLAHFGLGISSMHNRAGQCGGRLEIQSSPGRGTVVVLTIPISVYGSEETAQ